MVKTVNLKFANKTIKAPLDVVTVAAPVKNSQTLYEILGVVPEEYESSGHYYFKIQGGDIFKTIELKRILDVALSKELEKHV